MVQPALTLVDDDPDVQTVIQTYAVRRGWTVTTYTATAPFLSNLIVPSKAGVVILDINMPNQNGLEAFDLMRQRRLAMPVIFLTGHGDISDAVAMVKNGAFDFLPKPFELSILMAKIESAWTWLDRWRGVVDGLPALTAKEWDTLRSSITLGAAKEVARHLGVSARTVEFHKGNLLKKLACTTLADIMPIMERILKLA